jgi:hypothetical protein
VVALLLGLLALAQPAQAATADLAPTGGQALVGTARFTQTLTARPGRWSEPGVQVSYEWRSGGEVVAGEAGRRYELRPEDVGRPVQVRITATAPGLEPVTVTETRGPVRHRVDVRRVVRYSVETRGRIMAPMKEFRSQAQATYDDPRGWRSAGIEFRRVARGGAFTLVLSQASLVPSFSSQCSATWSCRVGRFVVINQDRWRGASPAWNAAGLALRDYRHMVVNHETGHWLGLDHARCPGPGQLAPVMQQQSKGLQGCRFNPFPTPGEIASRD